MRYKVFQNNCTSRALGAGIKNDWEELNKFPGVTEYMRTMQSGSSNFDVSMSEYWEHVADIEADSLDKVFDIGNIGPENKIVRYKRMTSISVGNIIVDYDGAAWMVDAFGFTEVKFRSFGTMSSVAFAL